jgi:AhpD family alkylhydroperoxidase
MVENQLQQNREARSAVAPFPGISPVEANMMGIREVMSRFPEIRQSLLKIADIALVEPHEGATITRTEREILATAVSAGNKCFFCMDSHAAHAVAVAKLENWEGDIEATTEEVKTGNHCSLSEKMTALTQVALDARENNSDPDNMEARRQNMETALNTGASQKDVDLAILIASSFSMFNRFVDGFGSRTPSQTEVYSKRAEEIALNGYSAPPIKS